MFESVAMASPGGEQKIPAIVEEREEGKEEVVVKRRQKPGRQGKMLLNGMVKDTRSMYISPSECGWIRSVGRRGRESV